MSLARRAREHRRLRLQLRVIGLSREMPIPVGVQPQSDLLPLGAESPADVQQSADSSRVAAAGSTAAVGDDRKATSMPVGADDDSSASGDRGG
jgi:hypothetical protein